MNIASIRREYMMKQLNEADMAATPHKQFEIWWQEAITSEIDEVNAMTLSTIRSDGQPTARIVLLKGFDSNGLCFFTNYESDKGKEIAANNKVCLLFFWKELERQIRIIGITEKVSEEQNDAYYFSRPIGSQIGAWASPQSQVIDSRKILDENVAAFEEKFKEEKISRPQHWGGYVVKPESIEFWQGRPSRLHDRFRYRKGENGGWVMERLAP